MQISLVFTYVVFCPGNPSQTPHYIWLSHLPRFLWADSFSDLLVFDELDSFEEDLSDRL